MIPILNLFAFILFRFNILVTPYLLADKGLTVCPSGYLSITTTSVCETACTELGLSSGSLKDNNACYKAGNGKCRQDGRQGSKVNLVCRNEGNELSICPIFHNWCPCSLTGCLFGYNFLNIYFYISNNYYHLYNLNYDDDINYVYHNNNYNNNQDFEGL